MRVRVLVVAKAPVPGFAKTRLAARVGDSAAADLAAAALLDTLDACAAAFTDCHLAVAGDLDDACRAAELRSVLRSWQVFDQLGGSFGERLAHAHCALAAERTGPVVQVGMDTPQLTAGLLVDALAQLRPDGGVIGPAEDGGWWLLGLADPAVASVLVTVPMSTARTGAATRDTLLAAGVPVRRTCMLRDVDTAEDAEIVAAGAPRTRFARAWTQLAEVMA